MPDRGEQTRGLSLLNLGSDYLPLPQTGLAWKIQIAQETEYLFGLDGAGLAVNQKFSLTSSRKRLEVPPAEAFSKSLAPAAPPPALAAGDPAQLLGGCWQTCSLWRAQARL